MRSKKEETINPEVIEKLACDIVHTVRDDDGDFLWDWNSDEPPIEEPCDREKTRFAEHVLAVCINNGIIDLRKAEQFVEGEK